MKRIFVISLLLVSVTAAMAQKNEARKNAIKINPISLALMTGNVSYERAVNSNQSVQIGVFYSMFSISGLKYTGFGVTPEYRIYIAGQKEAMNGIYVAPFARYQNFNLTEKETTNETTFSSYGGGATIGWEKSWKSGFVLDIFAGPSYNMGKFKNENDEDMFNVKGGVNGFGVRTGITLGFAF